MRHYLLFLFAILSLCLTSCRDDFEFEPSSGNLEFSKDTVYLDTVFTNIGSSTYTLKVYNRSDKDIKIPGIKLGQGEESKYRLMVDGIPGKVFNDVELLAKDSMFVFIETTIDYEEYANEETTFLYTDKIEFDSGDKLQTVELVTLVQDAIFIKPDRSLPDNIKETLVLNGIPQPDLQGHLLATPEELHWTNEKPYVVYGYAHVPNGQTLTIDAGARVHFHAKSGLIIDNTGALIINGEASATEEMENEVIFEGDRLEPEFTDTPGQWSGVYLFSGNPANSISHLTIRNAGFGISMERIDENTTPFVTISNSQIYNSALFGLLSRRAHIVGTNLVINNAGTASLAIIQGGEYDFKHCTFSNYFNSFEQTAVGINDYFDDDETGFRFVSDLNAQFDNCIMYGSTNYALSMERTSGSTAAFFCRFNTCFIKLHDFSNLLDDNELYPFDGNINTLADYTGSLIAENSNRQVDFWDPQNNNLRIGLDSEAKDAADAAVSALLPLDLAGNSRMSDSAPDIGAYEAAAIPED